MFEMCSVAETLKSVVMVLSNERTRDWIARLVEGEYWAIGLKQGSVMEGKERLLATRKLAKRKEERKRKWCAQPS